MFTRKNSQPSRAGRKQGHSRRSRRGLNAEQLENRTLLSNIVWTNQGSANDDSDNFNATYGANAAAARALVAQAMNMWEQVIDSFNYEIGSFDIPAAILGNLQNDQFSIAVDAQDLGNNLRGQSDNSLLLNGAPFGGEITMDDDAAGNGWFFDATPGDSIEFMGSPAVAGNVLDGDMGCAPGGCNANNTPSDFLRTILHEIGHSLGIADNGKMEDTLAPAGVDQTNIADNNPFNDADLSFSAVAGMTFTHQGGLHVYEGPSDPNFPKPVRNRDLMNAGRTVGGNTRQLISNLDAGILRKVYGYDVVTPSSLPNFAFFAHLNTTTGTLNINGGLGESYLGIVDEITLRRVGDSIEVDIEGIPGDVQFPIASVTNIIVQKDLGFALANGDGDDTLTLDFSGGNPIPAGGISYNGRSGQDTLVVTGTGVPSNSYIINANSMTIGPHQFNYSVANVETLTLDLDSFPSVGPGVVFLQGTPQNVPIVKLIGSDKVDAFNLNGKWSGADVFVEAGDDDDEIVIGFSTGLLEPLEGRFISVVGGAGSNTIRVNDSNYGQDQIYSHLTGTILPGQLRTDTGFGLTYDDIAELKLEAGTGDDDVLIFSTVSGTETIVETGSGNDTVDVNFDGLVNRLQSRLVVDGGGNVSDTLLLSDFNEKEPNSLVVTSTEVLGDGTFFGLGGSVQYQNLTMLQIDNGSGNDTIDIHSTKRGTNVLLHNGSGTDTVTVSAPADPDKPAPGDETEGTVDNVGSVITVFGQDESDVLRIIDNTDTTGDTATITQNTVGLGPSDTLFRELNEPDSGVVYFEVEDLDIQLGKGDDTVPVRSISKDTPTRILTGPGFDHVVVAGNNGTVNDIDNHLDIDGQLGSDTVTIDDSAEVSPTTVHITSTSVGIGDNLFGSGFLTYQGVEQLTTNTGSAADNLFVLGTHKDTRTSLNTGGGVDLIRLGDNNTVDSILSEVVVDGEVDNGVLAIIDSGDVSSDQVTIGATQIGFPGDSYFGDTNARVTYSNLNQLNLVGGVDKDELYIRSSSSSTMLLIGGGGGNDLLQVDSNAAAAGGDVSQILGNVRLVGGSGSDTVVIDNSSGAVGTAVSVVPTGPDSGDVGNGTADTFFSSAGAVSYQQVETLLLRMSDHADTIEVAPAGLGGTALTVEGNDPSPIGLPPHDTLRFDLGGVGSPTLNLTNHSEGELVSSSHAPIFYSEIEVIDKTTTGDPIDLVVDSKQGSLPGNDANPDVYLVTSGRLGASKTLQVSLNGVDALTAHEHAVNSLTINGSSDDDKLRIEETPDGLPRFRGTAPTSHTNPQFTGSGLLPQNIGVQYDGGPAGVDEYELKLIIDHNVEEFQDNFNPNSGIVAVENAFALSYERLTPILIESAGGSLTVNARLLESMSEMTLSPIGPNSFEITGDGNFETTVFSGFDTFTIAPPKGVSLNSTVVVNSTADAPDFKPGDGRCQTAPNNNECTLRAAIQEANAATKTTIHFDVPGTVRHVIQLSDALPEIKRPVTIDGYSQPGSKRDSDQSVAGSNVRIGLDGSRAPAGTRGLVLDASNSLIRGLALYGFSPSKDKEQWDANILVRGDSNVIEANLIGTDGSESLAPKNPVDGIVVLSSNNAIRQNLIQHNRTGVLVVGLKEDRGFPSNNQIQFNSIHSNQELGIDLTEGSDPRGDGPTENDRGDRDQGANGLQNYPVITKAQFGGTTLVSGRLNSAPFSEYELHFFVNTPPTSEAEGERFLGSTTVRTNSRGNARFDEVLPVSTTGGWINATATRIGDGVAETSEFSPAIRLETGVGLDGCVVRIHGTQRDDNITVTRSQQHYLIEASFLPPEIVREYPVDKVCRMEIASMAGDDTLEISFNEGLVADRFRINTDMGAGDDSFVYQNHLDVRRSYVLNTRMGQGNDLARFEMDAKVRRNGRLRVVTNMGPGRDHYGFVDELQLVGTMSVKTILGSGADESEHQFRGRILRPGELNVDVAGGNGADDLRVDAVDLLIHGSLDFDLSGGKNDDQIAVDLRPLVQSRGEVTVHLQGDRHDDRLELLRSRPLRLRVLDALLDGGTGDDLCGSNGIATVVNCEGAIQVPFS